MKEKACEQCGRPKLLVCYLAEDKSKYTIECPICGLREVVDEKAETETAAE